ncbi:MAG: hypothetical protein EOP61_08355 [Sphingomonadales bacterium]|nr:MAG: hypothetical protein EOP61_08355 [Sphingomonadales bacterium]
MAGLLSSLFSPDPHSDSGSALEANSATVSVADIQKGGEVETQEDGVQGAQSLSHSHSLNSPADGGAGDASSIGPPTGDYIESQ